MMDVIIDSIGNADKQILSSNVNRKIIRKNRLVPPSPTYTDSSPYIPIRARSQDSNPNSEMYR